MTTEDKEAALARIAREGHGRVGYVHRYEDIVELPMGTILSNPYFPDEETFIRIESGHWFNCIFWDESTDGDICALGSEMKIVRYGWEKDEMTAEELAEIEEEYDKQ